MPQSICCVSRTRRHFCERMANAHRRVLASANKHTNTPSVGTTNGVLTHTSQQNATQFPSHTQKGQKGRVGGHQCMDVKFKQSIPGYVCKCVSVQTAYVCLNAQVQRVGSLGVFRELFFTDGLREQPSLMDYFQLRIQVSHPAFIVRANSVCTAPNLSVCKDMFHPCII